MSDPPSNPNGPQDPGIARIDFDTISKTIAALEKRIAELESQPPEPATKTTDFLARAGQTIVMEAPGSGIKCSIVKATKFNRGQRVTFIQRNANPVILRAIDGKVNGLPQVTSNAAGTFFAVSDGQTGWLLDQSIGAAGIAGAPGTPGSNAIASPPGLSVSAAMAMVGSGRPGPPGPTGAGFASTSGPVYMGLLSGETGTPRALSPAEVTRVPRYSNQIVFTGGGTNNDFNPTNWADVDELYIASADAIFTGFQAPVAVGKRFKIRAQSGMLCTLKHFNAGSLIANRILCPNAADLLVGSFQSVEIEYQNTSIVGTSPRWVVTFAPTPVTTSAPLAVNTVTLGGITTQQVSLADGVYGDVAVTGGINWTVNKPATPPGPSHGQILSMFPAGNIPGPPGAAGAAGATGPTGPSGSGGGGASTPPGLSVGQVQALFPTPQRQAGSPGSNGVDGQPGAAGAAGPPGRTNYTPPAIIPGPTGPTGPTGASGVVGSVLSTATANFGAVPSWSGSFTITGLSGLVLNTPVLVTMAVDTTNPSESEEQVALTGIVTSTSVITIYWKAVNGPIGGTRTVQYLVSASASNLTLSEGQFVGLPITHAGPGTNGPAVPISGSVGGENIRWDTDITSTVVGDQGTTRLQLNEPADVVSFSGASPVIFHGNAFSGVGAGTAIQSSGRMLFGRVAASQGSVTFKHESTVEASATARFSCPQSVDFTAFAGDYFLLHRVTYAGTSRTRVMPLWRNAHLSDRQNAYTDEFFINQSAGFGLFNWIAAGTGAAFGQINGEAGHPGILRIQTQSIGTNDARINLGGVAPPGGEFLLADVLAYQWIFRISATGIGSFETYCGFGDDPSSSTLGNNGLYFRIPGGFVSDIRAQTRQAGAVVADQDTGVATANNNWIVATMFQNVATGDWFWNVNDAAFGTIPAAQIPTAAVAPSFYVNDNDATNPVVVDVDAFTIVLQPSVTRHT